MIVFFIDSLQVNVRNLQSRRSSQFLTEIPISRRSDLTSFERYRLVLLPHKLRYLLMIELGGLSPARCGLGMLLLRTNPTQFRCEPEYLFLIGLP